MSQHTHPKNGIWLHLVSILLIIFSMMPRNAFASSWNPTLIVNTEAFQVIDDGNTAANIVLRFGDTVNKNLTYDRTAGRFTFDADLYVQGNISATGTSSGSTVHAERLLTSSGAIAWEGVASGSSLVVSGTASLRGPLQFGDTATDVATVNSSSWTFNNDTNYVLNGGVNGLSFDTSTFSVDATNHRVGIGTTTPKTTLSVAGVFSGAQLRANNMTVSGAVVYSSGNTLLQNAKGSSGQVLISQATSAPKWATPTSSMVWYLDGTMAVGGTQGAVVTMPMGFTASGVSLNIKGAPTGTVLIVDIKKNGTSLFSTNPQINTAATRGGSNAVFTTTNLPIGSVMSVDITQVGSTFAGSGLTIMLNGTRKY